MLDMDIVRRAWGDTKRSVGRRWQTLVHYLVVPALPIPLWLTLGRKQAMDDIWLLGGFYLAGIFLLVVVSFLSNLWLAPYRMLNEKVDKLTKSSGITIHRSPAQGINVKNWEGMSEFQLGDAACLWVGIQPYNPIESEDALAMFKHLGSAVMSGQLKCDAGLAGKLNILAGKHGWPRP